tara:strand:- start:1501 stop:3072 length:1572 start_codon:yes stop_codon:yes gene_type:complete
MKNNSMKSRPITSRSKGTPLHKEDPEKLGKMNVVDAQGNLLSADDNVTSGSPGKPAETKVVVEDYSKEWDKEAAGGLSYAEWIKVPGNKNKEKDFVKSKTKTITTEGTEGTSGERTTSYEPKSTEGREADKVDTFLPWERRFAQRTQRGAVRDEIRRGKKGIKQLDKALAAGVITQEDYDKDYAEASKLAFGQGTIAKGQYTNTAGMDAILSQGYQANPAVSTNTDMLRKPQGEQEAGQPVKADGSEQMTKEEYEAGGKSKSTPKTSAAVQDASSNAGTSVTEDQAKQESGELPNLSTADLSVDQRLFDRDGDPEAEEITDFKREPESAVSVKPKQYKPSEPKGAEIVQINKPDARSSSSDMFGGLSTVELADLSEALTDQKNQATNEANEFTGDSVQANTGTGNRSDMVSFEPTAREKAEKEIEAQEEASKAVENELAKTSPMFKKGYKMNRSHSPSMMYSKNAPTRKMGSPLNKLTDLSGDGEVTQKDRLIGAGVLNRDGSPTKMKKSTAFKMKGYGNKNK